MTQWNDGYVTEIGYTYGYYRELSPTLQRFALLVQGFAAPDPTGAYLELGFGQGLSACIHAAATPCQIWGTDFNPSQVYHAQSLLRDAGLEAHLRDLSFFELSQLSNLPKFDYISAHGIWTWISNENRDAIVTILQQNMSVGGVAYLSYNTLPGWGSVMPLRHLLTLHAETAGAEADGISKRIDAAVVFSRQMVEKGANYFKANPHAVARLEQLSGQNRHYVAHEYFNRDWLPMHFADMTHWLKAAKLEYAASAHLLDHIDPLNLTPDTQAILKETGHTVFKESVRDYFVNQHFRRDLFQRGLRRLSNFEQREQLLRTRVVLQTWVADIPKKVTGALGEAELQQAIYSPLLEVLAKDDYM